MTTLAVMSVTSLPCRVFFVDARPLKIDDRDGVPRLASGTKSMAEHKAQGSFQHCLVRLLKASLFIKSENLVSRGKLLVRTREKAFDLPQSTVCGSSFFIWSDGRNTVNVPDVFQKPDSPGVPPAPRHWQALAELAGAFGA
jgi:hypothetical protein